MTALFALLRPFLPYIIGALVAFSAGWGGAWQTQGLRLTAAEQSHTAYVQEQTRLRQEHDDEADKQRMASDQRFARQSKDLQDAITAGAVYRRCVDAGKCRVRKPASCPASVSLSARVGLDAASANTVPLAAREAEEVAEPSETLANECAVTTLMLNSLQADIERQPRY